MNSGRFDKLIGRVRPGTYVNVDSDAKPSVVGATRGSVLIPLSNAWGPNGTIIKITGDTLTEASEVLGDSVGNIPAVNEALKAASTVLVYNFNKGEKASAMALSDTLTITAKYAGTKGNSIKVACKANADSGFDIEVVYGTAVVEEFSVADADALIACESKYVKFAGTSVTLAAFSATSLDGGTNTDVTNNDVSTMLDSIEDENISAIAFPFSDASLQTVAISKARYLRDELGKSIQIVVANCDTADYEGIINVVNGYVRTDGVEINAALATSYVAAITAAATELISNTYKVVLGADTVLGKMSNEQAEVAIKAGKFFFTQQGDEVIVEYDINSLHTFSQTRSESFRKNKVIRVYDSVSDTIRATFPPNKFPNSPIGWDLMDGLCQTILQHYLDEGAIKNVDLANDMRVNRSVSSGDSVYFDARIHAVDAAEKLYFTIITD